MYIVNASLLYSRGISVAFSIDMSIVCPFTFFILLVKTIGGFMVKLLTIGKDRITSAVYR